MPYYVQKQIQFWPLCLPHMVQKLAVGGVFVTWRARIMKVSTLGTKVHILFL